MKKTSPLVKKGTARTMSFYEALQQCELGKKITRLEWGSNDEYGFMNQDQLSIHTKGKDHLWIVSKGDMINSDWVILPL